MLAFLHLATPFTHLMARAGGGGSGGGGGGSGGGGGGIILIAMIGYLPTHFVTVRCMQRFSRRVALVAGTAVAVVVSVLALWLNPLLGILITIGAGVGVRSGLRDWLGRLRNNFTRGKVNMQLAGDKDPAWREQTVLPQVYRVFYEYQRDWSNFNVEHMQTYLEQHYYQHAELMMAALRQMGRRNLVENPELLTTNVVDVEDMAHNDGDRFSVFIQARANDQLIDTTNNRVLYTDTSMFQELWWFDRNGDDWDLMRIDQATADIRMGDPTLERFAEANGMFYSLDWGWLLLPQRGQLFSRANFKNSDVNNHVIGQWNGLIVQLYTYVPYRKSAENYLIAQLSLPKSYGGIIIRRNGRWSFLNWLAPSGYKRVSMEWPDFNKRYTVYATDVDQVTSFELLNPKFMADLYDKELPFNIEVVDNVVYLYAPQARMLVSGSRERYQAALDVLQAAYKELYM